MQKVLPGDICFRIINCTEKRQTLTVNRIFVLSLSFGRCSEKQRRRKTGVSSRPVFRNCSAIRACIPYSIAAQRRAAAAEPGLLSAGSGCMISFTGLIDPLKTQASPKKALFNLLLFLVYRILPKQAENYNRIYIIFSKKIFKGYE